MSRLFRTSVAATLSILSALFLDARIANARADNAADCANSYSKNRIRNCSTIIQSGHLFGKPIGIENLAITYANRGDAYSDKGRYDRAIADFGMSIELKPEYAPAYNSRAWAYFKAGKVSQGLPDANKALELNPRDVYALDTRGNIYEALGRRPEAIADFRKVLELDPSNKLGKAALRRLGATP